MHPFISWPSSNVSHKYECESLSPMGYRLLPAWNVNLSAHLLWSDANRSLWHRAGSPSSLASTGAVSIGSLPTLFALQAISKKALRAKTKQFFSSKIKTDCSKTRVNRSAFPARYQEPSVGIKSRQLECKTRSDFSNQRLATQRVEWHLARHQTYSPWSQ